MPSICQMPQVKKGDASSLRQLINHMSRHMNALQTLSLDVRFQHLMLNHLMLATLDSETQRERELISTSRADTPTTAELGHILGINMQSFRATSDYPVTEDRYCHSTVLRVNGMQGQ